MLRTQMKRVSCSRPSSSHLVRLLALLFVGGAIGACQNHSLMLSQATPQPSVKEKYPISVEPHQQTMQLSPVLAGKALASADAAQITDFAGQFLKNGHGPLAVILPGIPDTPGMRGQVQAINEILADRGVPASRTEWRIANPVAIPTGSGGEAAKPGPLVFSFTRYVASANGDCGNWQKDLGSYHDNKTWDNFGCASQHNLAAMIVDPLDLHRPRDTTPVDVDRRTVVIQGYRQGQSTTSERTMAEKGTVSEVAR